jgi:hypothetical protein
MKRMQVQIEDAESARFQEAARRAGITLTGVATIPIRSFVVGLY